MRCWSLGRLPAAFLLAGLLAGCGGEEAEDFTVEIKRPITAVFVPLSSASVAEAGLVFPGIRFERTRPSDREILYTIPATDAQPSTIRFKLEPRSDQVTVVHAYVSVPAIKATIDGQAKVLSEAKVEAALKTLLGSAGRSLEMGSAAAGDRAELSQLLVGLAIATDTKSRERALALKNDPGQLTDILMRTFGDGDDAPAAMRAEADAPSVDPDAAAHRAEIAQANADYRREAALENAAEPTSDLDRFDKN